MTSSNPKVLYYINQFFAGVGGEDKANVGPELRDGAVGPGRLLAQLFPEAEIAATLVCGDNFVQEHADEARAAIRAAIESVRPDVVMAGPAFVSGRYGLACGEVAVVAGELGVPALAGMSPDNPAVAIYRPKTYIVATGEKPIAMSAGLKAMSALAAKLAAGEPVGPAAVEGYLPRGPRRKVVRDAPAFLRAVDMLAARLHGRPFITEIPYQAVDRVEPAAPILDLAHSKIAIATTGGLIRKGNPDQQGSSHAKRYLRFDVAGMRGLSPDEFEAFHSGYFNQHSSTNPNYIAPLSYLSDLRDAGVIGSVHETIYSLVGVGTGVEVAREYGAEIADQMVAEEVDGCLLVAT